jgi:hypothetical protein
MLTNELEMENFKFVAALRYKAKVDERKATAVSTARADAEMTDATKPIGEIVDEKITAKYEGTSLLSRSNPSPFYATDPDSPFTWSSTCEKNQGIGMRKGRSLERGFHFHEVISPSQVETQGILNVAGEHEAATETDREQEGGYAETLDEEEVKGHEQRRQRRKR